MRVRLGFWLWGVRCALKPQWRHRGITALDILARIRRHVFDDLCRQVYGTSPIMKRLEKR